jgi:hypothetical protein
MENEESSYFSESKEQIELYIKDRLLLLKLQTAEKTARLAGMLFTGLILGLFSFFVLLFISMMGGYLFASLTGSLYCGFGIVAAFYLLILLLIFKFRKTLIEKWVGDTIIRVFFEKEKEDEIETIN